MNNILSNKIRNRKIQLSSTMLQALKQMDRIDKKLLLVFNKSQFANILSIGDIQRAVIMNLPLDTPIKDILRENTKKAREEETVSSIKKYMHEHRAECMPVLNRENKLVDVFFWEDFFPAEQKRKSLKLNLPVVIMAGGKGTRLKPLTNILPKPLLPIGEKTIIEHIMESFSKVGCSSFYISINYKADMIKFYLGKLGKIPYKISYIQEKKPLGTAGSLYLLKGIIKTTFFVSNCDIIVDQEYDEIYDYHIKNRNEITIVAALKHYPIPYGTIGTGENGELLELKEKPEITFKINSGMYILEPHLLDEIPENKFFHITQLIDNVQRRSGSVGVFPVSEGSWKDIGEWNDYQKHLY